MARSVLAQALVVVLVVGACAAPGTPSAPTPGPSNPFPTLTPTPAGTPLTVASPAAAPDAIAMLRDPAPRQPTSSADAVAAAGAVNAFGIELFRAARFGAHNAVISPASIALALGMARVGAGGTTAAQMDAVLRAAASPNHAGWLNALDQALASRNATFTDIAGAPHEVTLRIANALFAQMGYPIEDAYLRALAAEYGAGVGLVDYAADPDGARRLINGWVDVQTEHRIPELLAPETLTELTRLTLVDAIHLKAPWAMPFDPRDTQPGSFARPDGSTVTVPFMRLAFGCCTYASGDGWRAVDLTYLGGTLSLTLIVPQNLAAFVGSLSPAGLRRIVDKLDPHPIDLWLPRFSIESDLSLATTLRRLGMAAAFDPRAADFSGISSESGLHVGAVVQHATLSVDEIGTEAAAATAIEEFGMGSGPKRTTVRFDRPFLFALRDVETGAVLFLGQVTDPS